MKVEVSSGDGTEAVIRGYAQAFRIIGADLETFEVENFDLDTKDLEYWIRGCAKAATAASARDGTKFLSWLRIRKRLFSQQSGAAFELRYTQENLRDLDLKARSQRGPSQVYPDSQSLSETLRVVGEFLDLKRVCLSRLSMRGRWITLHYKSAQGHLVVEEHTAASLYSFWVGLCARRAVGDKAVPSPGTRKHFRLDTEEQDQGEG